MNKINIYLIVIVSLFLFACSTDNDDDLGNMPPVDNNITYTKNVKSIIDGRCISCHGNPPTNSAPMSLTTYQNVRSAVTGQDLIGEVESGSMPPSGANLTNSQIQIIKDWQTGGFKE
ncbi:hypothetical protein [Lutimonas sp.]|uniref:hypothetical protein n=1 Tax=Lutimonas sp. TaxID=1872403 RepID=UPI003D9ABA85